MQLGWIDDAGEWHAFPPPPEWEPAPIREGEWIRVWNGTGWKRRKAVPDPCPLFRQVEQAEG